MRRHAKHHVEWLKKKQIRALFTGTFLLLASIALELVVDGVLARAIGILFFVIAIYSLHKSWVAIPKLIKNAKTFDTGVETGRKGNHII